MDLMRVQSQRLLLNWKTNNAGSYLGALMHADEISNMQITKAKVK